MNSTRGWWLSVICGTLIVVCLWLAIGLFPLWSNPTNSSEVGWRNLNLNYYPDLDKAGQLGDTFGIANALFSGLGFLFVALALFAQVKQLGLQMSEAHETSQANERQIRISGFQALSEFYRSQSQGGEDNYEKRLAAGKEQGNIEQLQRTLAMSGNHQLELSIFKRQFANNVGIRYLMQRGDFDELPDDIGDPSTSIGPLHAILLKVAKDMGYYSCFPITDFGFMWDIVSIQSIIGSIIRETDLEPELTASQRRGRLLTRANEVFEHYKKMDTDAHNAIEPTAKK